MSLNDATEDSLIIGKLESSGDPSILSAGLWSLSFRLFDISKIAKLFFQKTANFQHKSSRAS